MWLPIETAPRDGTHVDLWVSGPKNPGDRITDCYFQGGKWWMRNDYEGNDCEAGLMVGDAPTHWMPIPGAP